MGQARRSEDGPRRASPANPGVGIDPACRPHVVSTVIHSEEAESSRGWRCDRSHHLPPGSPRSSEVDLSASKGPMRGLVPIISSFLVLRSFPGSARSQGGRLAEDSICTACSNIRSHAALRTICDFTRLWFSQPEGEKSVSHIFLQLV